MKQLSGKMAEVIPAIPLYNPTGKLKSVTDDRSF